MVQTRIISVFSFILAFCISILYWILRLGFQDNSFLIIVKVLGVAAFVLLLPVYINRSGSTSVKKIYFNDTILPIYALIVLGISGYVSAILQVNFSIVFTVVGYALLLYSLYFFWKDCQVFHRVAIILLAIFFAWWVGCLSWFMYLKPFFIEWLAVGSDKMDTLFHLAFAQMIKTYGIPSTGLDGVPYMNYHWGSHWFFAQLSNLLHVPVNEVYQLCFPTIIAPLLFRTFLSFVAQLQQLLRPQETSRKLNLVFWIVFFSFFIGVFINFFGGNKWAQYSTGGTGETLFMLMSESYTFSIILMFGLLAVSVNFWKFKRELKLSHKLFLVFFFVPMLVILIGVVKISTMFIVCCLVGYLFFRLRMFKDKWFIFGIVFLCLVSLMLFTAVYDFRDNHGGFALFYFYNNWNISLGRFLLVFYLWTYVFIVFYVYKEQLYKLSWKELLSSGKLLPIECVLCISLSGFIPSIALKIQNYDSLYFTEMQMWFSTAFFLTYIPFFCSETRLNSRRWIFPFILCAILIFIFFRNTKVYWRNIWRDTLTTRQHLLHERGHLKAQLTSAMKNFELSKIPAILKQQSQRFDTVYQKNEFLHFLMGLRNLNDLALSEKRKSLVYVDFRKLIQNPDWSLYCHNTAFIVPAFSGMAMIDGIDVTYLECGECCEQNGFGYHYYPKWKSQQQIEQSPDLRDLTERVREMGFENLLYYNIESRSFEKISCK